MKKTLLFITLLSTSLSFAQVGIGTTSPDNTAALDVTSTTQGMLVPRMTQTQRNAINSPATGLLIYQTDNTLGFYHYNGTAWVAISNGMVSLNDLTDARSDADGSHNGSSIFIGVDAGANDSEDDNQNVGIGLYALQFNTTGSSNTANGAYTLVSNTTGYSNTAIGYNSLYSNTIGEVNTANGYSALTSNTTGQLNTASGGNALFSNTTGNQNVANGFFAGGYIADGSTGNTTGNYNVFIGAKTKALADNDQNEIVIGYNATGGGSNTIQLGNTDITNVKTSGTITTGAITLPNTDGTSGQVLQTDGSGVVSWATPSSGSVSTFATTSNVTSNSNGTLATDDFVFGSTSLDDITGYDDNSRMFFDKSKGAFRAGFVSADQWNSTNVGNYSTAMGYNITASGTSSTAMGNGTTASGYVSTAMGDNTTASGTVSTAMGIGTTSIGYASTAMGFNTTASGWYSTAIGLVTTAGAYAETVLGTYNTTSTSNSTTNYISTDRLFTIGNGTSSARSDALVMLKNGNTTVTGNWSGPAFAVSSDIRLKENIAELSLGMDVLKKINTKQYHLKKDTTKQLRFGVIAQELKEVLPNLVNGKETENSYLSVNYTELIPVLINALKEQDKKIEALEQQNQLLEELLQRVEKLEKQ